MENEKQDEAAAMGIAAAAAAATLGSPSPESGVVVDSL